MEVRGIQEPGLCIEVIFALIYCSYSLASVTDVSISGIVRNRARMSCITLNAECMEQSEILTASQHTPTLSVHFERLDT